VAEGKKGSTRRYRHAREEPPRTCDRTSGRKTGYSQDEKHQERYQDYSSNNLGGEKDESGWMVF